MPIIDVNNVSKQFNMGEAAVHALRGVTVAFETGEYAAVMGPSGSGKSTLMNILGCLDVPTQGRYILEDRDVSLLDDDQLSEIRREKIGFIFQSFNLIGQLSVMENIAIPMIYRGVHDHDAQQRAAQLAKRVGLGHRLHHMPSELSGGEQQRVAIARSLANDPSIIMADEPTGNLDSKSGQEILAILDELHEEGKTILVVTHDPTIKERVRRVVTFKDGQLQDDLPGGKA